MIEFEAAARNRQREGALHFFASAHATRTDDAFRWVVNEIRIGSIDTGIGMARAVEPVAHILETDVFGHIKQLNVFVVLGAAIERSD